MAGPSRIEWTERTWNPTTGCTKVSQGGMPPRALPGIFIHGCCNY